MRVEDVGADLVDQRDPGRGQQERAHVRIAAGDEGAALTTAPTSASMSVLGRDPVEVVVVDHGDVARLEPLTRFLVRRSTRATPEISLACAGRAVAIERLPVRGPACSSSSSAWPWARLLVGPSGQHAR